MRRGTAKLFAERIRALAHLEQPGSLDQTVQIREKVTMSAAVRLPQTQRGST